MVKGHNKETEHENDRKPADKGQGQDRHLTNKDREKMTPKGRNKEEDPSGGTKKKNNI